MENEIKGLLVFYINVGQLPPGKAEAFVHRMKISILDGLPHKNDPSTPDEESWSVGSAKPLRLPKSIDTIFVPQRTDSTSIEYIPFDGVTKEALTALKEIKDQLTTFLNS